MPPPMPPETLLARSIGVSTIREEHCDGHALGASRALSDLVGDDAGPWKPHRRHAGTACLGAR